MAGVNPHPLVLAAILFATVAATAAGAASPPRLAGCVPGSPATVRPKKIIVACGDANFYFTNLSWSSWNAKHAVGSGIATVNDCTPNCAAGQFHTYRSTITLSRPETCLGGQHEYTRMAWRFPATFPAGIGRAGSQSLPCR